MGTRTYDPGKHFMTFNGIRISGFADGTYIEADRMADAFSSYAGSAGEVARIRSRDKRGSIKITLMSTSVVNDLLTQQADQDELLGTAQGALHIQDGNGTTVANSSNAWIKKRPPATMSKDLPTREWQFECDDLDLFIGGNA